MLALYAINHVSKAHARCLMKLLTLWRWYFFANSLEPGRDCRAWSESKLFGTLTTNIIFFVRKSWPWTKISRRQRSALSSRSRVRLLHYITSERETDKSSKDKTSKRQKNNREWANPMKHENGRVQCNTIITSLSKWWTIVMIADFKIKIISFIIKFRWNY